MVVGGRKLLAACLAAIAVAGAQAQVRASADVHAALRWIAEVGDADGRPFAVVDKKDARIFVFDAAARLVGTSPVLLGQAAGDDSMPGVGQLDPAAIPPAARTTPAGRFESEPGLNLDGEDVIWVDYDTGIAIHRVRPGPARERRLQRLASPTPSDNRVSLGCIVAPVKFYESVVRPTLGRGRALVYVLPETRPAQELFGPESLARLD